MEMVRPYSVFGWGLSQKGCGMDLKAEVDPKDAAATGSHPQQYMQLNGKFFLKGELSITSW